MSKKVDVLAAVKQSEDVQRGVGLIVGLASSGVKGKEDKLAASINALIGVAVAVAEHQFDEAADERAFGREAHTPCYVTFYNAAGYALRETMQTNGKLHHMDGRLHAQINRKAKQLGAHHWAIFKHWVNFDVPPDPAEPGL